MLARFSVLLAVFAMAFCAMPAMASPLDEGNRAYSDGKFEEARKAYLSAKGAGGSNLWYNLGNAYYRLGEKGEAALAYERALELEPGHPEATYNLAHLRRETGARQPEVPQWQRAVMAPEAWVGRRALPWIATGAFWGAVFLLVPLFGRRSPLWLPGVALAGVALWTGGAVLLKALQGPRWVVTASSAKAHVAPIATAKTVGAALPAGSGLKLIQERGDWVYAELPDANRGWLARETVQPVVPPGDHLRHFARVPR